MHIQCPMCGRNAYVCARILASMFISLHTFASDQMSHYVVCPHVSGSVNAQGVFETIALGKGGGGHILLHVHFGVLVFVHFSSLL